MPKVALNLGAGGTASHRSSLSERTAPSEAEQLEVYQEIAQAGYSSVDNSLAVGGDKPLPPGLATPSWAGVGFVSVSIAVYPQKQLRAILSAPGHQIKVMLPIWDCSRGTGS